MTTSKSWFLYTYLRPAIKFSKKFKFLEITPVETVLISKDAIKLIT